MAWNNTHMASSSRPEPDPLSVEKAPSISFKDAPLGTLYIGIITSKPHLVQSRDYETGEPATWPEGNPKMSVVIGLEIDGEPRTVWAPKPSSMFAALVQAQKDAGVGPMEEGGCLEIKLVGSVPSSKGSRLNAAKQYAARYSPPTKTDPFADTPPPGQPLAPALQPAQKDAGAAKPRQAPASRPVPQF